MQQIINSSSQLRKNHNSKRDENLLIAERLLAAEKTRLAGIVGYSINEFQSNMRQAIKAGAKKYNQISKTSKIY